MARRRTTKRKSTPKPTPKKEWPETFLIALAKTGNVSKACKRAQIDRTTAYARRLNDSAFAIAWTECLEIAVESLEEEARRRAHDGYLRAVYQGGALVGKVREYSDTLLIFLLKAHKPEKYRDNARVVHVGDQSAPLAHQHEHSGTVVTGDPAAPTTVVNVINVVDQSAILGFLGDLGLPRPAQLSANGGAEPVDRGNGAAPAPEATAVPAPQ